MGQSVKRADFDQYMVPCYSPMAMILTKGKGSLVWDQQGTEYIDFAGGIAVSSLGHCHPVMVNALQQQSQKLWHVSNIMTNEPALRLAKRLTELSFAEKVFFANSGAEANEAALKLARRYALENFGEQKNEIIAFKQGFHGRTFFTVTVGGQPSYSEGFGPKPQEITHLPYNDLETLSQHISDKTCAVMMEPLQGEGGIIDAEPQFLAGVKALCEQHNALLIFDEVQTGNGRTGAFYAYQACGVTPDILTTAKSLGGGFPIAAMMTTSNIAKHLTPGTHGTTYGGNALACAVAEAVINETSKPEVLSGVMVRQQWFERELEKLNNQYQLFENIRGRGLLLGAVLNEQWQGRAVDIMNAAAEQGVLILVAGSNVLRFTPSLIIDEQQIINGVAKLGDAIAKLIEVESVKHAESV
ncbi:aspartate aminotransferase family protein [Vibrio sp. SS-MA-C1-2]|uniref:aspartate aminotransferase family protein n=1 Tax=Vibrio sp. SS-MA-C1-2 TaxID=2908646 RepID=UPI001F2A3F92|nr:aspartate aminotransferase family protein [Vibrio sp. SS-MA-C1-2]UJF19215.1 aspartate aminotransferase family protein [Vibrio sp. SS-MA-C1-2]